MVAVVGAVLGLVEFGPLGGVLGALAPVPLWRGLGWVGAILARRHQQTRKTNPSSSRVMVLRAAGRVPPAPSLPPGA